MLHKQKMKDNMDLDLHFQYKMDYLQILLDILAYILINHKHKLHYHTEQNQGHHIHHIHQILLNRHIHLHNLLYNYRIHHHLLHKHHNYMPLNLYIQMFQIHYIHHLHQYHLNKIQNNHNSNLQTNNYN